MYSSSFNPYQGFPGYGKSRGKGIKGRPTLGYEDKVLNRNYEGEGANQWKDERIRQVFGMLARRKKAFCGDGQPISEVYLSFLQSDVGIHVATDHSTPGRGDAAEAFSAEDVAVHAGHLCWACSLQREGAQLQCARCVLRQRSYRASSCEISHSRKAPVHLPPDGFCNSAVRLGAGRQSHFKPVTAQGVRRIRMLIPVPP
mmetsp:Transcript_41774/g.87220  ORF Transcript_41774/g.87220 Transcript_41774/m.87220 type:complete len:200 (-) Transcript_41774:137-736(-)